MWIYKKQKKNRWKKVKINRNSEKKIIKWMDKSENRKNNKIEKVLAFKVRFRC